MIKVLKLEIVCVRILLMLLFILYGQLVIAGNIPADNSCVLTRFPNFSWPKQDKTVLKTEMPIEYLIQISTDRVFNNIIDIDTITLNRYVCDKPLPAGQLFWRYAVNNTKLKEKQWSDVYTFKTLEPSVVVKVGSDVQKGIAEAVLWAKKDSLVELIFTEKEYNCDLADKYFIHLEEVRNIVINGNGAVVNLLGAHQTFCNLRKCENISVQGFVIDYPGQMTFTQGRVIDSDTNTGTVDVELEPGFPSYDDLYFVGNLEAPVMLLDPVKNGKLKDGVPNYYQIDMSTIQKIRDRKYRLTFKNVSVPVEGKIIVDEVSKRAARYFQKGDRFVHTTRGKNSGFILYADNASDITFYDIKSHAVGSFHYAGYFCSRMNILHCDAVMKEGRWWQGNADGIHLRSNKVGPWVEYFNIEGIGDDGLALYARPMSILKNHPEGNTKRLILKSEHFRLDTGDHISFFNPRDGKIIIETTVRLVERISVGWLVEFTDSVPADLVIDGELQYVDQLWNRSLSCGDFVIRNSRFCGIRRYGNVFRAATGVIENNIYESCSSAAIAFVNETQYPNGLYCSDITIRNNKIIDSGFASSNTAPLFMMFKRLNRDPIVCKTTETTSNKSERAQDTSPYAQSYGPDHIFISGNEFFQLHTDKIIELWSVEDVVIQNNKLEGKLIDFKRTQNIVLKNVSDITYK